MYQLIESVNLTTHPLIVSKKYNKNNQNRVSLTLPACLITKESEPIGFETPHSISKNTNCQKMYENWIQKKSTYIIRMIISSQGEIVSFHPRTMLNYFANELIPFLEFLHSQKDSVSNNQIKLLTEFAFSLINTYFPDHIKSLWRLRIHQIIKND